MEAQKIVFNKLKKLTKEKFDESSDIYSIGIDSLDLVEMVTELEDELNIEIKDEDLEAIQTVGDVIKSLSKALK